METFTTNMSSVITSVTSALSIFLEPPIVWFVAASGVAVVVKLAKKLLPMKKG